MTRSVKVGDKVRVIHACYSGGQYKNGDVLTVEQVCNGGIVAEKVSRLLVDSEYELYEPIKVGDTVTLIYNFYNHEKFKADSRRIRKQIASLRNTELEVKDINKYANRVSTGKIDYSIPIELLEKVYGVDLVDFSINADYITTGVVDDGVIKGMDEPKKGDPVTSFKPGKKYVYSKELSERGTGVSYQWHDMCDGKEVDITNKSRGSIGSFVIRPQWCYEIPTLHRHTPEQISEAQRIIGEIVAGFKIFQCFYILNESDKELTIRYIADPCDSYHTIKAHCSPDDEYNRTIGLLVALCKATGRKLPDWV